MKGSTVTNKILDLYYEIITDENLLEDRREYVQVDYQLSYELTDAEAIMLKDLIDG